MKKYPCQVGNEIIRILNQGIYSLGGRVNPDVWQKTRIIIFAPEVMIMMNFDQELLKIYEN